MSEQSAGNLSFDERFQIISNIGSGCYGDVFKAYDNQRKSFVALKKIRVFDSSEGLPRAFYREISTLNQISHPNIATLHDTVRNDDNELFLNMEYCEYDLQALISSRLTPSQCLSYFSQICNGVSFLHQHSIAHRDLKPGNVLVTANNVCKITDFGLSRKISSNSNNRYTPHVGSGSYRAPEILAGTGDYSYPIDIWALGCILFQMVSKNSKRFILGGEDLQELQQIISIYGANGVEILSQFPTLSPFLSSYSSKDGNSLSTYLTRHIPTKNHWAIPLLEQMLQLDPNKRPDITSILNTLSSFSIVDSNDLPHLTLIESHGFNISIESNFDFPSLSKFAFLPPRVTPLMVPIYA